MPDAGLARSCPAHIDARKWADASVAGHSALVRRNARSQTFGGLTGGIAVRGSRSS